jgi:hypothetical protein
MQQTRLATVITANTAMTLYWQSAASFWPGRNRRCGERSTGFPTICVRRSPMSGLSARNLKYMHAFASAWTDREIVQAPLAELTWYHHLALVEKLDAKAVRLWYATRTVEQVGATFSRFRSRASSTRGKERL